MGCTCSRATPTTAEPTPTTIDISQEQRSKIKTPIEFSIQNENEEAQIIAFVNQSLEQDREDEYFVDIIDADPEAYNKAFVEQRQHAIDNQAYRSLIESWHFESLQQLTSAIKILSKNKPLIDCYWIIFYWIILNIEYDSVTYFSTNRANQSAKNVFLTKKGICDGYVNIYKYLCDHVKLPCKIVRGYSKGYGFDVRVDAPSEADHVWNAVQINQYWYLVEATWGAGILNDQKVFKRELNSYYFFPRPEQMIYHHLPENDRWQLLRKAVSMKQFLQMPNIQPAYFEFNLELIYPSHQPYVQLLPNKAYALVLVRAPEDVSLIADLKIHDEKVEGGHQVIHDQKRDLYCCFFAPNSAGKYKINIYAKRTTEETDRHSSAITLKLDIEEMPNSVISYPQTWKVFLDLQLKVISPLYVHLIRLEKGQAMAEILIETPDDVELLGRLINDEEDEIEGGHQVYYDATRHCWACCFAPNADGMFKAVIMAKKKSDKGLYNSAVAFSIDAKDIPKPSMSYPETWQLFHDLHLKVLSPIGTHIIRLDDGEAFAEIAIQTPDDVELLGKLTNREKGDVRGGHQVYYDRERHYWQCRFAPNSDGIFKADIMAKRKSSQGLYTSAVAFKIAAKDIPTTPLSYPQTWQLFYDLDLKIIAPINSSTVIWPDHAAYVEVQMQTPDDVDLLCKIMFNCVEKENQTLTQFDHEKKQWQLLFASQETGLHQLSIFARRRVDTTKKFNSVAEFDLNVTNLDNPLTLPFTYGKFGENHCRIYEPLSGILEKNAVVPFKCVIPDAKDVKLQIDSHWIDTEGYRDSIFQTEVKIGSKDVVIYAKYEEGNNYDALIKYSVH
ncbi:unnamed protein product [Adineta ricciae]|uniref:Transglutaminase-like domain-containing protein n=1 Tax=Adineta ricciae TaxID=249248 RepID=A0A815F5N9_ADIRI|nr:unnamed protein product [Adineta ricciae]CAF1324807.1 unnamed protein product [Adineta ricciae]